MIPVHAGGVVKPHPQAPWPGFSFEDWRVQRKYNKQDLEKKNLASFLTEREASINILKGYQNPDLRALHSGNGFKGEPMSAGKILVSWVAHDLYHIRQISLLCWVILKK